MTDQKTEMLVPERILRLLEAEGIRTLFGIPDPCFVPMFAIAAQRGWNVIAPRHEQGGAYMADGLYRLTGRPGVVIGNEGPGVANLAAAAITASKENTPTIFIAGQRARFFEHQIRRGQFQYTRQPRYFDEAMKFIGVIEHAEHVDDIFHEAFRHAFTGTPGPVFIEYPQDHSAASRAFGPAKRPEQYRLLHQRADDESLAAAADLLERAEQPILLVGNGVFTARAQQQVAELASSLACPIVRSPGSMSTLPGLEERTAAYASPAGDEAIARADAVLAVGTEIGEPMHYGVGRHWQRGRTDRKWIYIERDPLAFGVNRPIDVPLVGDLRDVVPQLVRMLSTRAMPPRMPERFAELKQALSESLRSQAASAPEGPPIHPAHMTVEVAKALPEDAVIIRDGGAVSLWGMAFHERPSTDIHWCQNFGHLGTGIPHAIGAQLAVGDARRVVLISGDSAFQFHIAEIETAVRKRLPVVMIVGCDYAWGLEVKVYGLAFGDSSPDVEARWSDHVRFDRIAQGYGAYGEFVERRQDIGPAITRALAQDGPAVVQIPIDPRANAIDVPGFEEFSTWYGDRGYGEDGE